MKRLILVCITLLCCVISFTLNAQTKNKSDDSGSILGQLEALEKSFGQIQKRIGTMKDQQKELDKQMQDMKKEIGSGEKQLAKQKTLLSKRLREAYKIYSLSGWEYQLASRDFSDFVLRRRYLKSLTDKDRAIIDQQSTDIKAIEAKRTGIEAKRKEIDKLILDMGNEKKALALQMKQKKAFIEKIKQDKALQQKAAKEMAEAKKKLSSRVAKLEKNSSKEIKSNFAGKKGKMNCPTRGIIQVGFGESAIGRGKAFHGGYDIKAKLGTKITTPASGRVVFSGRFRGFGNLIVLDHGNKYHSLYGHLRDLPHAVGKYLKVGQAIGYVGDTGSLKGAYLYFELRHKGKPINPDDWVRCR